MNVNEKESPKIQGEEEYERAIYLFNSGNRKESIPLFQKSANLNYPSSFLWLYSISEDKNEQDWKLKVEPYFTWYQSKAQDGKSDSLFNLGFCYHKGIGIETNLKIAIELYTKAAEQGFAAAQYNLGLCYRYGEGVPKNIEKAVEYYNKASEQGLAEAQYNLGDCYENEKGVRRNIKRAMKLYNKAAEQGLAEAQRIQLLYPTLKSIKYIFKLHNSVTQLYLENSDIGDIGAQAIADALKVNNTLTELTLSNNKIGDLGAQVIADALKMNNILTELTLRDNEFGDTGVQAIADALKMNNTLTGLTLRGKIGELGSKPIADALKMNNALTGLYLHNNKIGDLGAQAIADALKIDKFTVKETESRNTNISSIEQALKIKKVLLCLDLSCRNILLSLFNLEDNNIGDEGIDAIFEMLKVNNSLQELDISGNNFTDISKLREALKCNRSLTELTFLEERPKNIREFKKALKLNICLLHIKKEFEFPFKSDKIQKTLQRNEEIQTTLSKRIFECKNAHLSLLDYKILERVNVAVIFNNIWKLHQTEQTGKTYEKCLREYWELISLNTFSKYFLFILVICKLNQIPPFRSHLLGIPKEILDYIGSFLNPKDFSIDFNDYGVLKKQVVQLQRENQKLKIENQKLKKKRKKDARESENESE